MRRNGHIARENDRYDVEVRRLLYFGPARRRNSPAYRLLFYIVAPTDEDPGLVRILHLYHASHDPDA